MKRQLIVVAVVGLLAIAAGVVVYRLQDKPSAAAAGGAATLFAAQLPGIDGKPQAVSQWRGQVLVVNFWATWCDPCREEIPAFIILQDQYRGRGVVFVGIAVDQRDKVQAYVRQSGMNYPVLIGGLEVMDMARQLGNAKSVLPFTLIIDRAGVVVLSHYGAMSIPELEAAIKKQV
jgi:thiol-disulfide isomerase/thioredoxin